MDPDVAFAARYLRPLHERIDPFEWDDGATLVRWSEGPTIAFLPEIQAALQRLEPDGLPPFRLVVLLLAACRAESSPADGLERVLRQLREAASDPGAPWIDGARRCLRSIQSLPSEWRATPSAKAEIAERIFDGFPRRDTTTGSRLVVEGLQAGLPPRLVERAVWTEIGPRLIASADVDSRRSHDDVAAFGRWLAGLARDPDALLRSLRTGIDGELVAADVEPPPEPPPRERVRRLLDELDADPDLGAMARLARRLLALTSIPRRLLREADLPIGGYADISNRGPLDRLLPSELAHDDLTLAARVALDEALYLRRESPPSPPPHTRHLLVDVGVRTWGRTRIFASSVALALAGTADRDLVAARAVDGHLEEARLLDRRGLEEHLESLAAAPHLGASLASFAARVAASGTDGVEAVLIVPEASVADPELRAELRDSGLRECLIASVDAAGHFALRAWSPRGARLLRTARIDLETALRPPARSPADAARDGRGELPAIVRMRPFPFRLPTTPLRHRSQVIPGHGVMTIERGGRVLLWDSRHRGARELSLKAPPGRVVWLDLDASRTARALTDDSGVLTLWTLQLDSGEETRIELEDAPSRPRLARRQGAHLILVSPRQGHVAVVRLTTGEVVSRRKMRWRRQPWLTARYFLGPASEWHAIGFDGTRLRFELVRRRDALDPESPRAVFDIPGLEGPWCVTSSGRIVCFHDGREMPFENWVPGGDVFPLHLSADGHRLLARRFDRSIAKRSLVLYDFRTRRVSPVLGDGLEHLEPTLAAWPLGSTGRRRRFDAVGFGPGGLPALRAPGGAYLGLRIEPHGAKARLAWHPLPPIPRSFPFARRVAVPGTGLRLRVAELGDGRRAWLDPRGLVHLRWGGPRAPEVSIALRDGETAAWSSSGESWGPSALLEPPETSDHETLTGLLRARGDGVERGRRR